MKIYLVGGAVRDEKLGRPIKERDYVVVGASVQEMKDLGYRQVGKEFPVFLHPKTGEEYALARLEKKVNPGYTGFTFDTSPDVALVDDLRRRDLTINAMAETSDGELIDPYHGMDDIKAKMLRHVSPAFGEDPVRILRVARFYARYAHLGFRVADETINLMREMVACGEIKALVAERVWKEVERALGEKNPAKFFELLNQCDALASLFPELSLQSDGMRALIAATDLSADTLIRFAALLHTFSEAKKTIPAFCKRYRVPNAYRELALLAALHHAHALNAKNLSADELLDLFMKLDIFRREARFEKFLVVVAAIAHVRGVSFDAAWVKECAGAAKGLDIVKAMGGSNDAMLQGNNPDEVAKIIKTTRSLGIQIWLGKQLKK